MESHTPYLIIKFNSIQIEMTFDREKTNPNTQSKTERYRFIIMNLRNYSIAYLVLNAKQNRELISLSLLNHYFRF